MMRTLSWPPGPEARWGMGAFPRQRAALVKSQTGARGAAMRATLLIALAWLAAAAPAHADRYSLDFDGAVLGVLGLGKATIDISVAPDRYDATATLKSGGVLSWFEKSNLTANAQGLVSEGQVRWRRYDLDHHYAKKHRTIAMQVSDAGETQAEIKPNFREWGEPPTSVEQKRASRDPLSSIVAMAVDVARTRTCTGAYPTFDGRFHYELVLSGGEQGNYDSGGYDGPVLRCKLAYVSKAGFNPRKKNERLRIPEGEMWFALIEGETIAPPVRALLPMPIGKAGISLSRFRRVRVEIAADPVPASPPAQP